MFEHTLKLRSHFLKCFHSINFNYLELCISDYYRSNLDCKLGETWKVTLKRIKTHEVEQCFNEIIFELRSLSV